MHDGGAGNRPPVRLFMEDLHGIKLIVTDLDGTALRKTGMLSDRTLAAFARCRERGIKIAFATGRSFFAAKDYLDAVRPDAAVLSYGAHVMIGGETVFRRYMRPKTANRVLRGVMCADKVRCQLEDGTRYMDPPLWDCLPFDRRTVLTERVDHICAWGLGVIPAYALARAAGCSLSQICGPDWCNFSPYGCNKGRGTRLMLKALGIMRGEALAFGDEDCDIAVFTACGTGVCTANGDEATRTAADCLTADCDHDGVAQFIEEKLNLL